MKQETVRVDGMFRARDALTMAAWFGLVTGLSEGIARTALQTLGGVSWELLLAATSVKIIWIAPIFYLALFLPCGGLLVALSRIAPPLPMRKAAVFLFGLLGFMDLLSSSGRLNRWGIGVLALGLTVALLRRFNAHEAETLRFWRKTLPWIVAASFAAWAGVEGGLAYEERSAEAALGPARAGAPNVLVIVVDTLRADHLGCYGYARSTSPNIDRLAREGVLFEEAYATSSWTLPSHASILTGLYPSEHGALKFPLDKRHRTLPEALRERGYRTAAFSANTVLFTQAYGFGRGFIRFEDYFQNAADMFARTYLGRLIRKHIARHLGYEDLPGRKRAADINRSLLRWIDRNPAKPFFAFLNYFDVHDPYLPPQPYRSRFSTQKNPGGRFNSFVGRDSFDLFTKEILENEVAAYDGALSYVDDQVGTLMAELNKRRLTENTIVVLASDHGESFGEHGLYGHETSLYREQVRVPLIFRWPGKIAPERRVNVPVSLAGLAATILDWAGEASQEKFPGPSLVKTWNGEPYPDWPDPMAELAANPKIREKKVPTAHGSLRALVSGKWYYIVHEKFGPELYDVVNDPLLQNNLAHGAEGRAVIADLEKQRQEEIRQRRESGVN
ncbi:MAG: sulfatase [Acidobacteria bacterium]|nr:sulfatase [Acidobacteriota bacterium]